MDLILFISKANCETCPQAQKIVESIAKKFRKDLHVETLDMDKPEHRQTANQQRITKPPALLLEGEPIFTGKFPTEQELEKLIEDRLSKQQAKKGKGERSRWWSISGLPEQWGDGPER